MGSVLKFFWFKRIVAVLILITVSMVLVGPTTVAQSDIKVLNSTTETEFPNKITFNLTALSGTDVTDIRLQYWVDRSAFAEVTSESQVEFKPERLVKTSWVWDMKKSGGLPPGATIEYQWLVKNAGGNQEVTPTRTVLFQDTRYEWRYKRLGKITLYWHNEDIVFADELLDTVQQAMVRLMSDSDTHLERPINIYIYHDAAELRGAMINPQEWTGGVAFTEFGILAIGISPRTLDWGKRAISHELTHLVVHQITFNPYSELPTWLDEGLAMYAEGEMTPDYLALLKKAVADNRLISVRSLASPFSAYANLSYLSYAESMSLVSYLMMTFGQMKMMELLSIFKIGSTYDEALRRVYGFDTGGLNERWLTYVKGQAAATLQWTDPQAIILTLVGVAALTGLFLIARRRMKRQ